MNNSQMTNHSKNNNHEVTMFRLPRLYKLTLKDKVYDYQTTKREAIENRLERMAFNANVYLSTILLGYKDQTTMNKFYEPSSSTVKFGMDDFAQVCIEIESEEVVDDFCEELKELIREKKKLRKEKLSAQLNSIDGK